MPKELSGWLRDVVNHSMKRPRIAARRERGVHSLVESIADRKSSGLNAIIAEYKRASPSGFQAERDLVQYIEYLDRYVAGFSIVTEEMFFKGSYEFLEKAARHTSLPILMKDFIVTEDQIETAYNLGADSVLLIARILTEKELEKLVETAKSYKLEPLVEIHNIEELNTVLNLNVNIIGVNSRDLQTLNINLDNARKILQIIPKNIVKVAESGIKDREDIEKLKEADAYLIGTTLMKNPLKILELL